MKKFAVVSSILALFGAVTYYVTMSIVDLFKTFEDPFSIDEEDDEF